MEQVLPKKPKAKKKDKLTTKTKTISSEEYDEIAEAEPYHVEHTSENNQKRECLKDITQACSSKDVEYYDEISSDYTKDEPSTDLSTEKPKGPNILNDDNRDVHLTANINKTLNLNKQLVKSILRDQQAEELTQIRTISKRRQEKITIRPYTESQLATMYTNTELEMLDQFTSHFIEAELKGLASKNHTLYELLANYLQVLEKMTGNKLEMEQLMREYKELQPQLWSLQTETVTGRGQCQDGTSVIASQPFKKATLHRSVFQSIVRILNSVQTLSFENHILYSYSAEDLRLQIEIYIQSVISNCINAARLPKDAPVVLLLQDEPLHLKAYLAELRLCISVIFAFQRKAIRHHQFIKEIRDWLSRLVAVLLRLATYHDHLFILSHVLRCPAGVSSWATSFIQTPLNENVEESPYSNYQINHILTILSLILSKITDREKFLSDIAQSKDGEGDVLWVMVDSEGEEDEEITGTSLRENDLVALLNQLPLDSLFRLLLHIKRKNFQDVYDDNEITEHHILKFFAFSTVLIKILYKGLQSYNQSKYNQFCKRLSRFIRHVVQYATDQWERFQKVQNFVDTGMMQRLQVEYDAFFLRAIYYLYSSQKLGAWQFLAVIPYSVVSLNTLWKIFFFLHESDTSAGDILNYLEDVDYHEKLEEPLLKQQFIEKLSTLTDAESYYLLNTFANMALARDDSDMEFIKIAAMDLLQVGYIAEATQEMCSKSARILLTHITSKHPHLLSDVFKKVKEHINQIGSPVLFLYEELPLSIWLLTDQDFELISRLLLNHSINDVESKLGRMIISRLNYGFNNKGELMLPYDMHREIALLALKVSDEDPGYIQWAWQTVLRLKLHINDKGLADMSQVPEPEYYGSIMKGLRTQQPLASFVALLMTSWGHLVPMICNKGLPQVLFLQSQQKYEASLFALYLIVPLFLDSQECLINSENFQKILQNLLLADRSYITMAKSLVSVQNTVLQQFGNMVETQIANFRIYQLESPRYLVRLWINSLVSVPNWNKDYGIMYLLDVIIRASFFHSDALDAIKNILRDLIQCSTPQEGSGAISSLFKWVSSTSSSNTLISSSLSPFTWLAYVMIDIEFEAREEKTGLWKEILLQLNSQKGKVSVDAAIKKAASSLKIPSFTSSYLCIYRWAQQALDTAVHHPLLPLLWQKFFSLYLTRISVCRSTDKGCVGDKFFDGIVNFSFMKRLKKRLQETLEYYQQKVETLEDETEISKKTLYISLFKLFQAYVLWLEEPMLQEANLLLPSLPPQYQPNLLGFVIQGIGVPWYEYLDYEAIKYEQRECIKVWEASNFRFKSSSNKPLTNPGSRVESNDPVERILRRLTSYDAPKAPPPINNPAPVVPIISLNSKEEFFRSLEPSFRSLKQFAHNHSLKLSEHKALDCSYMELIPQLYRSVHTTVKKKIPCKGRNQAVHCSGPAIIELQMQEARVNERIDHQIQNNRSAYESLLAKTLQPPAISLCTASVTLQQAVRLLQLQLRSEQPLADLGVELFYCILSSFNEETLLYLPTKTLFAICLEKLGRSHICEVEKEMPRLLDRILKEPNLGGYLAPHFSPNNISTSSLLSMYSTICKNIGEKYDITFALLSKFDIEKWLTTKQPKLMQRSQFIEVVIKSLASVGFDPSLDSTMLHGLYRKHLLKMLEYQFPEHYIEILLTLLKSSNGSPDSSALISLQVWIDIINFLSHPLELHFKVPLRDQLRQYAQHQKMLNHQEFLETAEMLSRHFTQERLQYGLYGIYPKCRNYIDVFSLFLGMVAHGLTISTIKTHEELLGDKLCEKIWPNLRDLFAPWIAPYSMQSLRESMASWIQQLTDDRSVLLPWIASDAIFAQKIINVFYESILFIVLTLPASGNIFSFFWQWYVVCFAHHSVKEYILTPIHSSFIALPWNSFWPSVIDIEFMLKVVNQYLPECHSFLGHIFISISWINWLHVFANSPQQVKSRVYQCYINLLIKLSNEPNIRSKHANQLKSLLVESEGLDWEILDPNIYQHVIDWYVLSCDSVVVLKEDEMDLDYRVFHFLKSVSGYQIHDRSVDPNLIHKRVIFTRGYVKLVSVFANKHKSSLHAKEKNLIAVMNNELQRLESLPNEEELSMLLQELLGLLNINSIENITSVCFHQWISNKPGDGLIITVLLHHLGLSVINYEILGSLYEQVLTTFFQNKVSENFEPTWTYITEHININVAKQAELEQILLTKGYILTLNAILLQRIKHRNDYESILQQSLEWLSVLRLSENVEPKVPLLWRGILRLAVKYCEVDEPATAAILYKLSQILLQLSEGAGSSGWGRGLLSAMGLSKQSTVTLPFRFLCKALAGYLLAQLPDMKGEPQTVRHTSNAPFKVGQPGGNSECVKILLSLDFGQNQGKIKESAEVALKQIQDANNSLHNASKFLFLLVKQFYIKNYLREN